MVLLHPAVLLIQHQQPRRLVKRHPDQDARVHTERGRVRRSQTQQPLISSAPSSRTTWTRSHRVWRHLNGLMEPANSFAKFLRIVCSRDKEETKLPVSCHKRVSNTAAVVAEPDAGGGQRAGDTAGHRLLIRLQRFCYANAAKRRSTIGTTTRAARGYRWCMQPSSAGGRHGAADAARLRLLRRQPRDGPGRGQPRQHQQLPESGLLREHQGGGTWPSHATLRSRCAGLQT